MQGTPYSFLLGSQGGNQPVTWSLLSGFLPSGLNLNAGTGEILGIGRLLGRLERLEHFGRHVQLAAGRLFFLLRGGGGSRNGAAGQRQSQRERQRGNKTHDPHLLCAWDQATFRGLHAG